MKALNVLLDSIQFSISTTDDLMKVLTYKVYSI